MNFSVETYRLENGMPVVKLGGEVDVYTTPKMKEQLASLIESGSQRIAVDLSEVNYFDSTALGALIGALRRVKEQEGSILVIGAQPRVRRVFEVTGLDGVFEMYESADQASKL
jgi:anti-sigma B factor antagonist